MAASGVVIILAVLCGVFAVILILVAACICRRILRRRKLQLRDEMEMNRLLVEELVSNGDSTGGAKFHIGETIVLPAQHEVVDRDECKNLREDILTRKETREPSVCPATELSAPSPTPSRKVSIKDRLYRKRTKSISSGSVEVSPEAPSTNTPRSIDWPLLARSKSMFNLSLPPSPNSSKPNRFGSLLSLDAYSDGSDVFSDSISAPPSPASPRSEAEETLDDSQGSDMKRRKSSKGSKPPVRIQLEYSIYYSSAESTLVLSVKGVTGIPSKYSPTCASFVRVYLTPKTAGGYLQTCIVRKSLEPMYNDQLQFSKISLQEVWVNSLRFKLYVKGQWGGHHESLAEATRHCVALIQGADEVYEVSEVLKLKRRKWKHRSLTVPAQLTEPRPSDDLYPASTTHTFLGLGDLFLSIQYQHTASRFKVMVRKADHLMSKGMNLPGTPSSVAHYIAVNLLRDEQAVVQSETTRSVAGSQPTWNQPFLLHLSSSRELTDYRIEFVLLRVRFPSGGRLPIGSVVVGPKVQGTGGLHWDEVVLPRLTEVTRWHTFQPV